MLQLSSTITSQDLSTEAGLQAYLQNSPFAAKSVVRISGGYSNYTFRIVLSTPYEEKETGLVAHSVIIKHAREYAATAVDIPLSIDRMEVEIAALRIVPTLPFFHNSSISSTVQLAHVFAYEKNNHITVLQDFGALPSLKDYIMASTSTVESSGAATATAKVIGTLLGSFLAHLHVWGYHLLHPIDKNSPPFDTVSILDPFRNNAATTAAKQLCAWRTAGRLVDIASRYEDLKGECDWDALRKTLQVEVMEREETFTMGDFWTGNILVKTSPSGDQVEQLVILDWELSKLGISAADIGQFTAEALLLQHYAASPDPGSALVASFLEAYESALHSDEEEEGVPRDELVSAILFDARAIAACTAAHQAVWGTLGSWDVTPEVKEKNVKGALKVCAESTRVGRFQGLKAGQLAQRLSSLEKGDSTIG